MTPVPDAETRKFLLGLRLGDIPSNSLACSQNIVVKTLWPKPHLRRGQNLTYKKFHTIHNNSSKTNALKIL